MDTTPAFSVIIPVFNKWELTSACLRSLREHTPEYDYEVIVVDNASSDDTASELSSLGRSLFGARFHTIRFSCNRNFAPACNAGAVAASAPLLFFLNNDTLLTPGWAPPLLAALADDPKLGGVGPLLLYENKTVQHLGVTFEPQSVNHLYQGFPSDHPVARKRRYFQSITAAALLMPAKLFHKHNGFYEEYRNGFEDVDLCLRIRATGKYFTCIHESVVYHLESQTPGRSDAEADNVKLLFQRCEHLFRMDKHLFGRDDGFVPFINDWCGIGLRMTDNDETALCREAEGQPPFPDWFLLTRKHPFWIAGREFLIQALKEHGRSDDTLFFLAELVQIEKRLERYEGLMLAAAQADNTKVFASMQEACAKLAVMLGDRRLQLRKIMRLAGKQGDAALESLYIQALKEDSA